MFKIGDRVKVIGEATKDHESFTQPGTVESLYSGNDFHVWVIFDGWEDAGNWGFNEDELELVSDSEG